MCQLPHPGQSAPVYDAQQWAAVLRVTFSEGFQWSESSHNEMLPSEVGLPVWGAVCVLKAGGHVAQVPPGRRGFASIVRLSGHSG